MEKIINIVPNISSYIDDDYPHIAKKILLFWGYKECLEYIESLLQYDPTPDRPDRAGFPFIVITDLHQIYEEHGKAFPFVRTNHMLSANSTWYNR